MKNIARFGWTDDDMTIEERSPGAKEMTILFRAKGSAKSGNYNHAGRPGLVGGSAPKRAAFREFSDVDTANDFLRSVFPDGKSNADVMEMPGYDDYDKYTGLYYKRINRFLRGDEGVTATYPREKLERHISNIDSLMEHFTVPENVTVFRGAASRSIARQWDSIKPGDEFMDKGYVSTSVKRSIMDEFSTAEAADYKAGAVRVNMTIRVPAGSHALASTLVGESELTLPRGSKFRVLDMKVADGIHHMELELVQ